MLRDVAVLHAVGFHGVTDELRHGTVRVADRRPAGEHLRQRDLRRLVEIDPGRSRRSGLAGRHRLSTIEVGCRAVVAVVRRRNRITRRHEISLYVDEVEDLGLATERLPHQRAAVAAGAEFLALVRHVTLPGERRPAQGDEFLPSECSRLLQRRIGRAVRNIGREARTDRDRDLRVCERERRR